MKTTHWSILVITVVAAVVVVTWLGVGKKDKPLKPNNQTSRKHTNALIRETSPYLLQHAHNPVDWLPWSDEAFEKAEAENKPVFLSVGYSTCHWCHVMAHESFEDEQVAELLNKHFVCIKVDREELPDVDAQYMLATQIFFRMQGVNRGGGWPNSVWLTPDRKPWYAGTYYPKPQFMKLLEHLNKIWTDQPKAVREQADTLARLIEREATATVSSGEQPLNPAVLKNGVQQLTGRYDPTHGGFGRAPKFPPHGTLALLIRHYEQSKRLNELEMISHTLDVMRHGGIWDHIGGGFHRYSTDQRWLLPHFEKMLYDNAQLMRAYTDGHRLTGRDDYLRVVAEIFAWLRREMTDPAGGFYSAQDADSPVAHGSDETEEGKYYVWTPQQVINVLGEDDGKLFNQVYNIVEGGNFEDEAKRAKTGDSIPHLSAYLSDTAEQLQIEEATLRQRLETMRDKLLAARLKRPRPHLDDKVLVGWNGLMIGSLAHAGRHLKVKAYVETAAAAADFILNNLRDEQGRLKRTWRKGMAKGTGYLTDYAYFAEALLELHAATDEPRWLEAAEAIADRMIEGFADPSGGGFYFTSDRHERLLVRAKNLGGGGNMPDANGVASRVLLELAVRSNKPPYGQRAASTLQAHAGMMWHRPHQAEQMILATDTLFTLIEKKQLP
ncbi:MAG: thioredoxin domain-containing protein, partial [Phycisphaeraceae bacterium]|nr:thioredoxin domain-containing protein [Phycisphaeraceae bacterium]